MSLSSFPSRVTITLPPLLREALAHLREHQTDSEAVFIEKLLADAIAARLRGCLLEHEDIPTRGVPRDVDPTLVPERVEVHLDDEHRQCLAKVLLDNSPTEIEKVISRVFEWGLENYAQRLSIELRSDASGAGQ